jgi:DNA-binding transcriptional ArsR family regulator
VNEKELEKVFKAFANKRRLAILKHLKKTGKSSVGDISSAIKLSFKATSKHLSILSNANITEKEQISLTVLHFLPRNNHSAISKLLSTI